MFIPIDPNDNKEMWNKFKWSLMNSLHSIIITDGNYFYPSSVSLLNESDATCILDLYKKCDYIRIGSSKLQPFPPHFAINFIGDSSARLDELITLDNSEQSISNAILLVLQFSFFEIKHLKTLTIPFIVPESVDDPDVEISIDEKAGKTIIIRK